MSNAVSAACRSLAMVPTAKSVLMALADYADDSGKCWPSIPTLCEYTCFSRRAVIDAIAWLESAGAVQADRSNGRHTSYAVTPDQYVKPVQHGHRCISRTSAANNQTSAPGAPDPCSSRTGPVQQAHPNHQEPSRTIRATTSKRVPALACPDGVEAQTWTDWLALRKAKKAPVTETVLKSARSEAEKAGVTLGRFLEIWCARGSQGLEASWLKPNERAGPAGSPSKHGDFGKRDYGTGGLM